MTEIAKTVRKALREPEWVPSGNKIAIQLDLVESFSHGGIFVLPSQSERDAMNQTEGTVAAMGPLAFKDMRRWDSELQAWIQTDWVHVGDRVKFQKHHGWVHMEKDSEDNNVEYRIMHDTDLTMVYRGKQ
jgi:co-chaperonin GroES (HSP10)